MLRISEILGADELCAGLWRFARDEPVIIASRFVLDPVDRHGVGELIDDMPRLTGKNALMGKNARDNVRMKVGGKKDAPKGAGEA